ncbi:metallophosphoesterase [Virgibacillus profundi]|uniref:metallophosphoesterase n=1 Tax=Virgibacillus profundi TaxID=2024555 RepID=UPI0013FD6E1F|nr:metallophosphoesterase [Virgibacillus profundi]
MRKVVGRIIVGILIVVIVFVIYTLWDNNRITIAEQEINIDNLPYQLEDFRILQITDLHEKQFGKNQKRLIDTINSIEYDAIVFTGDMLDGVQSTNYQPFYSLLEGIDKKENAWYVPGNADPDSYQVEPTFGKSEFIIGMEERGVQLLESIDTVEVEGVSIHFTNFELSIIENPESIGGINGVVYPSYTLDEQYLTHQKKLWRDMQNLVIEESDIMVALNHYPVPDLRIDYIEKDANTIWRDFDLIIAGHYHGGQIRIPFYGAIFIPDPWYEPNSFFPPQNRVKGLWEYKETKQYVSTGLGSSDAISFLKFRLFNPPEINLSTLKGD